MVVGSMNFEIKESGRYEISIKIGEKEMNSDLTVGAQGPMNYDMMNSKSGLEERYKYLVYALKRDFPEVPRKAFVNPCKINKKELQGRVSGLERLYLEFKEIENETK